MSGKIVKGLIKDDRETLQGRVNNPVPPVRSTYVGGDTPTATVTVDQERRIIYVNTKPVGNIHVVATRADLDNYDVTKLQINDVVEVLEDETYDGAQTYNKYTGEADPNKWEFLGKAGPYVKDVKVNGTTAVDPTDDTANIDLSSYATETWVENKGYLTSVSWSEVTNKPNFATVATTGSYNDLKDKPTIPTIPVTDVQVNGVSCLDGTIAKIEVPDSATWGNISGTLSDQTDLKDALDAKANSADLAQVATSGDYEDLINKPVIPEAPVQDVQIDGVSIIESGGVANIQVDDIVSGIEGDNDNWASITINGETHSISSGGGGGSDIVYEPESRTTISREVQRNHVVSCTSNYISSVALTIPAEGFVINDAPSYYEISFKNRESLSFSVTNSSGVPLTYLQFSQPKTTYNPATSSVHATIDLLFYWDGIGNIWCFVNEYPTVS